MTCLRQSGHTVLQNSASDSLSKNSFRGMVAALPAGLIEYTGNATPPVHFHKMIDRLSKAENDDW